jgi:hypothetical protein
LTIARLGLTGTLMMIGASVIADGVLVLSRPSRAERTTVLAATD